MLPAAVPESPEVRLEALRRAAGPSRMSDLELAGGFLCMFVLPICVWVGVIYAAVRGVKAVTLRAVTRVPPA
jgi:hypothetical protein